jgi:flagellin
MPITINTNTAASTASFNLSKNSDALRKSLARLSSGNRITQPAEDAGGLAVSYKLNSSMKRTEAVLNNHQNALSYLQVQDGALESVGNILNRMAELRTMSADITKNAGDIENYSKEFRELQEQLSQLKLEKFNGVSLFASNTFGSSGAVSAINVDNGDVMLNGINGNSSTKSLSIGTGEYFLQTKDSATGKLSLSTVNYEKFSRELLTHPSGQSGDGSIGLNVTNLQFILSIGSFDNGTTDTGERGINLGGFTGTYKFDNEYAAAAQVLSGHSDATAAADKGLDSDGFIKSILNVSIGSFTEMIQRLADARAENGAEQQRVQSSYEFHQTNLVNLEAAHGRIMDVDVALESTRFAKNNVLVQASASMTAQANQLTQVALTLLQ